MSAYATALHEARHGVMSWLHQFPVNRITLSADGRSGKCYWEAPDDANIHAVLMVCLAGTCLDGPEDRSSSDVRVASSKYTAWCRQHGPQAPFEWRVAGWLVDCRRLLMDHDKRVLRVANALLASRDLTAHDLDDSFLLPAHGGRVAIAPRPAMRARPRRPVGVAARTPRSDPEVEEARMWLAEAYPHWQQRTRR